MPCIGVEPVLHKLDVKLATKQAALSIVLYVQSVTCLADAVEPGAIGCTVPSKPTSAMECNVCDAADGANVSGTKTASKYSADQPTESLGVAGSSLLYSGSDLTAPPLIMFHL